MGKGKLGASIITGQELITQLEAPQLNPAEETVKPEL